MKIEDQICEQNKLREKAKKRIERELAQQSENLFKRLADRRKRKSVAMRHGLLNSSKNSMEHNNVSLENIEQSRMPISPNTFVTKHKIR